MGTRTATEGEPFRTLQPHRQRTATFAYNQCFSSPNNYKYIAGAASTPFPALERNTYCRSERRGTVE